MYKIVQGVKKGPCHYKLTVRLASILPYKMEQDTERDYYAIFTIYLVDIADDM